MIAVNPLSNSTRAWRLQQAGPQVRPVHRRRVDEHVHGRLADLKARVRRGSARDGRVTGGRIKNSPMPVTRDGD